MGRMAMKKERLWSLGLNSKWPESPDSAAASKNQRLKDRFIVSSAEGRIKRARNNQEWTEEKLRMTSEPNRRMN